MINSENSFWRNINKFKKDHNYLESFFWRSNKKLTKILNNYHKTNLSTKSWTILLYPWLYYYQSTLYDRWKIFSYRKNKHKKFFLKKKDFTIKSSNEFFYLSQDEDWNNYLYFKIKKFKRLRPKRQNLLKIKLKKKKQSRYSILSFYILKFIRLLFIKSEIFYSDNLSFNKKNKIRNIYNFLILKVIFVFNKKLSSNYEYDLYRRSEIFNLIKKEKKNNLKSFENFFYDQVAYDLPCELIEGFHIHSKYSNSFPKVKKVFTNFLHYNDVNFKFFVSKFLEENGKVNIIEHGGGLPWKSMNFFFEEKIFTKKFTWAKKFNLNQKQFHNDSIKDKYFNICSNNLENKKISIITSVIPKYFFKMALAPQDFNYQNYFRNINNFLKNVKNSHKENIFLKPHPSENNEYYKPISHDLKNQNKKLQLFEKNYDFKLVIQKSKILICTSPETTFTLSMLSGVPTILILNLELFKLLNPKFKGIIKKLLKSKMLFINSFKAANHLNRISNDPLKWYNSKKVREVRMEYLKLTFNL